MTLEQKRFTKAWSTTHELLDDDLHTAWCDLRRRVDDPMADAFCDCWEYRFQGLVLAVWGEQIDREYREWQATESPIGKEH